MITKQLYLIQLRILPLVIYQNTVHWKKQRYLDSMNSTGIGNYKVKRDNYLAGQYIPLQPYIVYRAFNNIVCVLAPLGYSQSKWC